MAGLIGAMLATALAAGLAIGMTLFVEALMGMALAEVGFVAAITLTVTGDLSGALAPALTIAALTGACFAGAVLAGAALAMAFKGALGAPVLAAFAGLPVVFFEDFSDIIVGFRGMD